MGGHCCLILSPSLFVQAVVSLQGLAHGAQELKSLTITPLTHMLCCSFPPTFSMAQCPAWPGSPQPQQPGVPPCPCRQLCPSLGRGEAGTNTSFTEVRGMQTVCCHYSRSARSCWLLFSALPCQLVPVLSERGRSVQGDCQGCNQKRLRTGTKDRRNLWEVYVPSCIR